MARIEKTVFISYRRKDVYTALAVYENLKNQGYDIFFDYRSIASGDFEQVISSNIRARAHFLLILTPTALDRCNEPGDWLRREIELAIDEKRNIVPLFFKGFRFGIPAVKEKLTGKLKNISRYNGLNVHEDYFEEAMQRVREQFLSKPLDTVLHPISTQVQKVVEEEKHAADQALKHKEEIKEPAKQEQEKEKPVKKELPKSEKKIVPSPAFRKITIPWKPIAITASILMVIVLFILGGTGFWEDLFERDSPNTPVPELEIGSTKIGKDGMTLLYVPAGGFTMGSDADDALAECQKFRSDCQREWFTNEEPLNTVYLNAYWIDQTEVTNNMYAQCVEANVCDPPRNTSNWTRDVYYGNEEFDDFPVTYVDWNMARGYCEWANRRLPTEAEWEKAARGQKANIYPWGSDIPNEDLMNDMHDTLLASKVGSFPKGASPYDVLDMSGNVWEWVSSLYQPYPYVPDDGRENLLFSGNRILRGGMYEDSDNLFRSASRVDLDPEFSNFSVGFRCAMDAE